MPTDNVTLLMVFFWLGFSIFLVVGWLAVCLAGRTLVSMSIRVIVSGAGLVGCVGAAGMYGDIGRKLPGSAEAMLLGCAAGAFLAWKIGNIERK